MKKWLDLYIICFGIIAVLLKKQIVWLIKKSQPKVKLTEEQEKMGDNLLEIIIMIGGVLFAIVGVFMYFGILKGKH